MYGRRRDSKVLLHFGLRGRASVDFAVIMDEGQVLALFIRICFLHPLKSYPKAVLQWGRVNYYRRVEFIGELISSVKTPSLLALAIA